MAEAARDKGLSALALRRSKGGEVSCANLRERVDTIEQVNYPEKAQAASCSPPSALQGWIWPMKSDFKSNKKLTDFEQLLDMPP